MKPLRSISEIQKDINITLAEQLAKKVGAKKICWVTNGSKREKSTSEDNHLCDTDSWSSKSWANNFERRGVMACALIIEKGLVSIFYL